LASIRGLNATVQSLQEQNYLYQRKEIAQAQARAAEFDTAAPPSKRVCRQSSNSPSGRMLTEIDLEQPRTPEQQPAAAVRVKKSKTTNIKELLTPLRGILAPSKRVDENSPILSSLQAIDGAKSKAAPKKTRSTAVSHTPISKRLRTRGAPNNASLSAKLRAK
jgi:hypothetical protein